MKRKDFLKSTAIGIGALSIVPMLSACKSESKKESVNEPSKQEVKELDDEWLMKSEPFFPIKKGTLGETNNYAKWFHVFEHESNYNGQIKFIKSRFLE